jgi:small subunit ribosomal protein S1
LVARRALSENEQVDKPDSGTNDTNDTNEEDFATLFAASAQTRRFQNGQTVDATIVAMGPEVAFVDVGAKGEATIDLDELKNDDGVVEAKIGDRIQATIVSTTGGVKLSRKLQRGAATRRQVEDAFRAGLPVEGKVDAQVKGGYTVSIAGLRAFCPGSQIDATREPDPSVHLGRVYTFRIIEYREDGRKFVVSRRALLEVEQKERADEVRRTLSAGAVVTGRVVSVPAFGAFIDLGGGVQGLLHVSEMGWSRVNDPSQMFKPGDEITVKILRIESKSGEDKIALGLKQLSDDPWSTVAQKYAIGQAADGRVTRIAEFGAFVELEPGVEALAHASTFPPTGRPGGWAKTISIGTSGTFEVLSVDPDKKRLGVAMIDPASSRAEGAAAARTAIAPGARLTGKIERHEPFGIFVFLGPGVSGLLPLAETGVEKGGDLKKAFPIGANVDVIVTEADAAGRRIRLSIKAIADAAEQAEVRDYAARADAAADSAGFGSLADKLRGALSKKPT